MSNPDQKINLTEYAHGAGCGCKIAPQVLQEMLQGHVQQQQDKKLLVGNSDNDDAAVYLINEEMALIATTDFFTPIVDDAFDFGRIAAANAISDVYAMGGRPALALAILGWPIGKLSAALASRVIDGAKTICNEAGIVLAGGHTVDSQEPLFGLSVNGFVKRSALKQNNTAREGDLLFLTKPLGTGIMATAQKRKLLAAEDLNTLVQQLTTLNKTGEQLGGCNWVSAMTDVTGFGLLGHLIEMCKGAGLAAELNYGALKKINHLDVYLAQNCIPDATYRNWNAYQKEVKMGEGINVMEAFQLLPDPQTNGGLLFSVRENALQEAQSLLTSAGLHEHIQPIGRMVAKGDCSVSVQK